VRLRGGKKVNIIVTHPQKGPSFSWWGEFGLALSAGEGGKSLKRGRNCLRYAAEPIPFREKGGGHNAVSEKGLIEGPVDPQRVPPRFAHVGYESLKKEREKNSV